MANVVVQAAAGTPNVVKVTQPGIAASQVVRSTEVRGTITCLLYTSPSPRDKRQARMPSSA